MRAVEVYVVIGVTLMTTLGLPKTCHNYCNFPSENSSNSPVCNCSHQNVARMPITTSKYITTTRPEINDSGINYDPLKPFFSQKTSIDEQTLRMLSINPIIRSKHNSKNDLISAVEPFAEQRNYDENVSKSTSQYKKSDTYFTKSIDETKELPLQLYLDIDIIVENDSKPELEELKNMFENFQAAEKNLSECINLHIYIFSKSIDNINQTNMNWDQKVKHDNLSNIQQLTEIESKCDQPASIIKQSIYQIKQSFSLEDQTNEINEDEQDTVYTTDSYKDIRSEEATIKENGNVNVSDMNPNTLSSHSTDGNNENDVTETADIITKTDNTHFHQKYLERDGHAIVKNNNDITSTSSSYEDSTVYDKINLALATDPTDFKSPGNTSKINRMLFSEKDMEIPRIITKELSNSTVVSVVDGYEQLPNSDFILTDQDNNITSTNETMSDPDLLKTDIEHIEKIIPSDIVNIHGNLFFSFGEKQIPARFIQQADGELDVAIDGFSMCHQLLEQNTTNFMNSLCKCIIRKNCT